MKPTDADLLLLLKQLVKECQEHNAHIQHMTAYSLIQYTLETIDKLEQSSA